MRYYKLTNLNEIHHEFQYKDGLNIDTIPFNPSGQCSPGGLYFFSEVQLSNWSKYIDKIHWIRLVEIPHDAKVYHEEGKSKADKLFLHSRKKIDSNMLDLYINFNDREICSSIVKLNVYALAHVQEQTESMCIAFVEKNGHCLRFVNEQTEPICLAAVKQNGYAIKHVQDLTKPICLAAVKEKGLALEYVKDQTEYICLTAVEKDGYALIHVKDQTKTICLAAVKENWKVLQYVKDQTESMCLAAIKQNWYALKYVNDQTEFIVSSANSMWPKHKGLAVL